ncbi:nucleotidyl transferase AbiEii/AbiGii toxin family protein [Streptomyces subrutilus]|uniref:nucleotidyl transferase AbiEii/AbiGii toxin family protein n=1 Tax=Streptomyces subrutilus TaxID=36818 RepID=UPI001E37E5FB|nr:nucleotidyl transferase AbiEii/AbiGii toxin family protein [Streptomyces subrutilus]
MTPWDELGWHVREFPREPLDDATRSASELPPTLRPVAGDDVRQPAHFDPSLRHHLRAYRAGDPVFDDPARTVARARARRAAMEAVLLAISDSPRVDSLVLRGSGLLADRFGEAAREPGWTSWWCRRAGRWGRPERPDAGGHRGGGRRACRGRRVARAVRGHLTYDRAPGRRMVPSRSVPGPSAGQVRLDFVFDEHLTVGPEPVALGCGAVVLAATPALSLAWKLLWIVSDGHPQGKDLYDAALLAERYALPHGLLQEVFRQAGQWPAPNREVRLEDFANLCGPGRSGTEWRHFEREYPHLARPGEQTFLTRLVTALRPVFDETETEAR